VSGTGFLFTAPDEFGDDELVEMEITVNPLFVIRCAARIMRRERVEDGWAYGAAFQGLSATDMSHLAETLVMVQARESDSALSFRSRVPLGA
jgi:hypothetical protein